MASPRTITYATRIIDGVNQTRFNEKELPEYTRPSLVYAYDAAADTFTVELDGEQTMRVANVRRDYLGGASECCYSDAHRRAHIRFHGIAEVGP